MCGLIVAILIGIALLILGFTAGSNFMMIIGVALIAVPIVIILWLRHVPAQQRERQEVTDNYNELMRYKAQERYDKKLAELDYHFYNWLSENGGLWILSDADPYDGRVELTRRDGTVVTFDSNDYGVNDGNKLIRSVSERLECVKIYDKMEIGGSGSSSYSGYIGANGHITISEGEGGGGIVKYLACIASPEAYEEMQGELETYRSKDTANKRKHI